MHIWGTLSIVPADQPPHPGEGVEVVKDVSGVPWARTKPATGMVTGCNALIQPPGMPVIVSLHPVCPLCHSTTLLIPSPRAAIVGAARMDGFNMQKELPCIHAPCGLPGPPGCLGREHAEMCGGVWDYARSATILVALQ